MAIRNVLVTGANTGIGKECCRQLALHDDIQKVFMACRNENKAKAAKTELENATGGRKTDNVVFEIVIMDVTDPESIEKAVSSIDCSLDGIVLNAGGAGVGAGVDPLGKENNKFETGVINIFALNVLGNAHLVDLLMKEKKLIAGTVVYSGSEASRGVKSFGGRRPELKTGSVDEFISIGDGSMELLNMGNSYAYCKLIGALWIGSVARKHSKNNNLRFVSVSPGGCIGTEIFDTMPFFMRWIIKAIFQIMYLRGTVHDVGAGAGRYIDALTDTGSIYKNGFFYASKDELSGPAVEQNEIFDVFCNETYQDNATAAINKFLE